MKENKNQRVVKKRLWFVAILASIAVIVAWETRYSSRDHEAPFNRDLFRKLANADHFKSEFPAQRQTIDLAKKAGSRSAALNAIGMEPRDVAMMATGSPLHVFASLSHLGGFGEIIWVEQWTNFPVKLPAAGLSSKLAMKFLQTHNPNFQVKGLPPTTIPRREAVSAALAAIESSRGRLIKAGEHRYLVARKSERKQYEAAIQALGWLDGVSPPWVRQNTGNTGNVPNSTGALKGGGFLPAGTNQVSLTPDSRRIAQ